MRFFILIALCLAVATATYNNRNRFNRLIRKLQQQGNGNQGRNMINDIDIDIDDYYNQDDQNELYEDNYNRQCSRYGQECNIDLEQNEYDSQEVEEGYVRGQHQTKTQQQKRHQCKPKYHLVQELEETNTHLASKLYKQAKHENDDKNTVVSPTAIQLALAAIARGAQGNTRRQIRRVIGAALSRHENQQAHAALQQTLKGQDPQTQQTGKRQHANVKTTTTIIINQRNRAQQKFVEAVHACVNTQVKKCDFQNQPQNCRQQINHHIAKKTQHKLQHVVPQDAVTTNTKMIVVSTTQVKATWGRQFRQQQQTKTGRFHPLGSQNNVKHVQVIQSQGQFNYYEDEQLHVVGLPTKQEELTMYVIVPKDKDGLNQIEKEQIQNGQQLKQLLQQAEQQRQEIDIELPKFQIKHKIDAKQTLRKEGIQHVFDADEADLSGINGQRNNGRQEIDDEDNEYETQRRQGQNQLHVNKLIHQATIKIDETGIHAAQTKHQRQVRYSQNQDQEYDNEELATNDEDDDENDEGLQQYRRQQLERDETLEEIFGQQYTTRRHGQRRQHRRQTHENQMEKKIKVNRAFAFAIKHNPSNQIILVGRVVDATQKPKNGQQVQVRGQQSLNGVDQQ